MRSRRCCLRRRGLGAAIKRALQGRDLLLTPEQLVSHSEHRGSSGRRAISFVPLSISEVDEVSCFDSTNGGMGIHYVKGIDESLSATEPEAMVYQLNPDGSVKLVAVEYIIPAEFIDPANPPRLLGQTLHPHSFLPVCILHAWIWRANPDGMFADFNPIVPACP